MSDPSDPSRVSIGERLRRFLGGAPGEDESGLGAGGEQSDLRLRVREFETSTVRDVMISRVDVSAVEADATIEETLRLFAEEGHSRMPIFRGSLDEPLGFVHIKDIVSELVRTGWSPETLASRQLQTLQRGILFVPESMPLPDLLVQMQGSRIHMAIVVDEYGGTGGLVCLEDVVEQIVGDIEDEHDDVAPVVVRRSKNIWEVDGAAMIEDLERDTGLQLVVEDFEDEIETISGLASALAGRVPQQGDIIEHPAGMKFEVLEADPRRVTRLRIKAPVKAQPPVLAPAEPPTLDRSAK
jgi:CBS domain containing-hemolysin-like protein